MSWTATIFCCQKEGERPDQYEDASSANPCDGRFAIADGATNGHHSRKLALDLVESWTTDDCLPISGAGPGGESSRAAWHDRLMARWKEYADQRLETAPIYLRDILQDKIAEGPGATLLLLAFDANTPLAYQVMSLGDCCFALVRDGTLVKTFPWNPGDKATPAPQMVSRWPWPMDREEHLAGTIEASDTVLLMTDALAAWLLTNLVVGREWSGDDRPDIDAEESEAQRELAQRVGCLVDLRDEVAFLDFVTDRRAAWGRPGEHGLKNDDVTLMAIRWESEEGPPPDARG